MRNARASRSLSALSLLLLALGAARAVADEQAFLEDPDYRFRIASPGPGWRLLGEADARQVTPDAVAGLTDLKGTNFAVIVEEAPDIDLDRFVGVVRSNMPIEEVRFDEVETLVFHSFPARRWDTRGKVKGISVHFRHLVFLREGFAYQLIGFGVGASQGFAGPRSDLSTLAERFSPTEGPVKARAMTKVLEDARGVGWDVRDGVYRDAANGLEVAPPPGWRLAVGAELLDMNDSACVGLIASDPETYLILIVEPMRGIEPAAFTARVRKSMREGLDGDAVGKPVPQKVGGREFSLQTYRLRALPHLLHHGVRIDDGRTVQVQAWHAERNADRAGARLREAYAAIRFLGEPARAALERELLAHADPQDAVGPGYALRGGVYRDFEGRFTWTKPRGFWKAHVGADARAQNEIASLFVEEAAAGLAAMVIVETGGTASPAEYHRTVVAHLEPKDPAGDPASIDLGGATALFTEVRPGTTDPPMRFGVATLVDGERAYQVLVWGLEGNVEAARPRMMDAVRAFRPRPDLVAEVRAETSFLDHRMGFRLRRPAGSLWRFQHQTPAAIAAVASMVGYGSADGTVIAGAFCTLREEQDERFVRGMVLEMLRERAKAGAVEPEETTSTLAGLPARRMVVSGGQRMVAWIAQRGRTFYLLIAGARPGASFTEDEASTLLELLD